MQSYKAVAKSDGIKGWPIVILLYLAVQSFGYALKLSKPLYLWLMAPRPDFLANPADSEFDLVEIGTDTAMLIAIVIGVASLLFRKRAFPNVCTAILLAAVIMPPAMSLYHQVSIGVPIDAGAFSRAFVTI